MTTARTKASTSLTLAYALIVISFSSWQTQARKTNWNEINSVLQPRTQGLHNYDSTLFKRSEITDAFNETWAPLTIDKDEKERKGSKGFDDAEQGKKSKTSTKVTPPPKAAPAKETSFPTFFSPSTEPSLNDDVFFVVPLSKKRGKNSAPQGGSIAPTASMPPSSIPSISPPPTFSPRPTILRDGKSIKSKASKTFAPTGPYQGSKKAKDREKSKKAPKNEAKTSAPAPPPTFKDDIPKFTMKKSKAGDGKGNKSGSGSGKGKGGAKEGDSSKAKLEKSKSSKLLGSERPSVAPIAADSSPPVLGSPSPGLPETSKCMRLILCMIVVDSPLELVIDGSLPTSLYYYYSHICASHL